MSICAIIPVASLAAANAALEAQGFGPNNFSVPAYGATGATHAALHAWDDPPFNAAVKAIAGVVYDEGAGDPVARTKALIEAQGAQRGANAPPLPTQGNALAGTIYAFERDGVRELWYCIQTFNRSTFSAPPETYPALIRRQRIPGEVLPWVQALDQFGAYNAVNPFTGEADRCIHVGKWWMTNRNVNVWEPGTPDSGWIETDANGNPLPEPEEPEGPPAWKPWDGYPASLYAVGAEVMHNGQHWVSTTPNNHWEPGIYGWVVKT